jgi:hypothetical protein
MRKGAFPEERKMAANQATGESLLGHADMDYPAHLSTYRLFTSLVKWGTGSIVLILILLAFFTL